MDLLILNGVAFPEGDSACRGTYRGVPTFCDDLPPVHELNRLSEWYLEEGGERGVVHDPSKAIRLAELWNSHLGRTCYEVVEVTDGMSPPETGGTCLGFDLSAGHGYSLLGGGSLRARETTLHGPSEPLCELMLAYFTPRLNENRLFANHHDAAFCLRVMGAIQQLQPNIFESGDLSNFSVVGVYVVLALC